MNMEDSVRVVVEDLNPGFRDEVALLPGGENIKRCFACGTCSAGCPVTNIADEYSPRRIIRQVLLGMREEVLKSPVLWLCVMCYRCYARCPQQVNFTDVMQALRHLAIRDGYAPTDMLSNCDEIDSFAQLVRRDIMQSDADKREQIMNDFKAKLGLTED
jgi:heterodisulfide reductase subunit C